MILSNSCREAWGVRSGVGKAHSADYQVGSIETRVYGFRECEVVWACTGRQRINFSTLVPRYLAILSVAEREGRRRPEKIRETVAGSRFVARAISLHLNCLSLTVTTQPFMLWKLTRAVL
jgi:hypothetical protein